MLRRFGWLGAVTLLGAALLIPGTAAAAGPKNALHQTPPISWNNPNFQGSGSDCAGAELAPGEVLWHFIHTGTDGADLPASLTATFDTAGLKTATGFQSGNSVVMYEVVTGQDTLLSASDSIVNDGNLNLSHICSNVTESTSSSTSTTATSTSDTSTSTTTSETGSVSDTTSSQDTSTTTSETGSVSDTTSSQDTSTTTSETGSVSDTTSSQHTTTSETGAVSGETGTPGVTPPSTATTIGGSSGHSDGWRIILLALAGLAVLSLILLPSDRKSKQH